jgi:hypothetical protein
MVLLTNGCDPAANSSKPRLAIGEEGRIECGGSICGIAATEEAWRENRKSERAGDIHGTAALMMAGKLTTVENGTKVLVIDYNPRTALMQIRVLEGKGTGVAGWVPFERIIRQAPDNNVNTKAK